MRPDQDGVYANIRYPLHEADSMEVTEILERRLSTACSAPSPLLFAPNPSAVWKGIYAVPIEHSQRACGRPAHRPLWCS